MMLFGAKLLFLVALVVAPANGEEEYERLVPVTAG
jgi:hypothetical protein